MVEAAGPPPPRAAPQRARTRPPLASSPRPLPSCLASRHRIGRTARGGKGGTAISLVCPDEPAEEALLGEVHEAYDAGALQQFHVDMTKLAAFRYRVDDAMRAVTRHAVKEARLKEVPLPPSPQPAPSPSPPPPPLRA